MEMSAPPAALDDVAKPEIVCGEIKLSSVSALPLKHPEAEYGNNNQPLGSPDYPIRPHLNSASLAESIIPTRTTTTTSETSAEYIDHQVKVSQ